MLYIITREGCPYCAAAKENLEQLTAEDAGAYKLPMVYLNENDSAAEQFDFYYAPAYFWDNEKLAEGEFTPGELREIIKRAHSLQNRGAE